MQMPTKLALLATALVVTLGFAIGFIHWNLAGYKCFDGKGFYGAWQPVWSVGKLELRVKPWGCPVAERYDPTKWQSLSGAPVH